MSERVIAWFSCGAASAVASKLAIAKYGDAVTVAYCDTMASEHPDNKRFFEDVQRWLHREIVVLKSDRYEDIDDVFMSRRYLAGIAGAPCTVEMKKAPRFAFQRPDDIHVFGYTKGEEKRAKELRQTNPELYLDFPLISAGYSRHACKVALSDAGIALPAMYKLHYEHNNCIGCVKSSSVKYWQAIRQDFPETFERRARQSRELGARLVQWKGERIFLDELPPGYDAQRKGDPREDLSCGPQCALPFDYPAPSAGASAPSAPSRVEDRSEVSIEDV